MYTSINTCTSVVHVCTGSH